MTGGGSQTLPKRREGATCVSGTVTKTELNGAVKGETLGTVASALQVLRGNAGLWDTEL